MHLSRLTWDITGVTDYMGIFSEQNTVLKI